MLWSLGLLFFPALSEAEVSRSEPAPSAGFVDRFVAGVVSGEITPIAVQTCPLVPAHMYVCNATGHWQYSRYGNATTYFFEEDAFGNLQCTSSFARDPWTHAAGLVRRAGDHNVPASCPGGMVPPHSLKPDVTIRFNITKTGPPSIITHTGMFSADCNAITMDDGGAYTRVLTPPGREGSVQSDPTPRCAVAHLTFNSASTTWHPGSRPGWRQINVGYDVNAVGDNDDAQAALVRADVILDVDPTNTTVRVSTKLTALDDLPFCLGGIAILKLRVQDGAAPTILHGSSGGPAGADTAFQPWSCELGSTSTVAQCSAVAGTPARPFENISTVVAEIDSDTKGRSSNFQLPIHSVEVREGTNASRAHGVWMAPEYSGIWRMDAYWNAGTVDGGETGIVGGGGNTFYWSLPSFLFTMSQSESVQLPWASFGQWDAQGGASDWANAVRLAIATHYTPPVSGAPVKPLAVYQGLGALPSYQTEDVLYETTARVQRFGVEAFIFDAGTYTSCQPASQCNGSAVWENKCCERQGAWWTEQGDYMPRAARFPEHGFMALERAITATIPQYGIWITPQAAPNSPILTNHSHLYLAPIAGSTSYLLNLMLPEAQDLFYGQFVEMIETFNCSRIWFDYNTDSRLTHWNAHESLDRQGMLERGFYEGLYAVFDRTRKNYPHVWIEGCASGGRMIDLGSLTRVQSMWINDDSISDDKNRRLRLGANHFLPAHYLQNAFLPLGTGSTNGHSPSNPLSVDPQRLLTYFNGVLQFGQGVATWDESSLYDATMAVAIYKTYRHLMDPRTSFFYRLFERPHTGPAVRGMDLTKAVGWIYEEPSSKSGLLYLMRQSACNQSTIAVALTQGDEVGSWSWEVPAPLLVRTPGSAETAKFDLIPISGNGIAGSVQGTQFVAHFPAADTQVMWTYSF